MKTTTEDVPQLRPHSSLRCSCVLCAYDWACLSNIGLRGRSRPQIVLFSLRDSRQA